jgi:hypothetical protein
MSGSRWPRSLACSVKEHLGPQDDSSIPLIFDIGLKIVILGGSDPRRPVNYFQQLLRMLLLIRPAERPVINITSTN